MWSASKAISKPPPNLDSITLGTCLSQVEHEMFSSSITQGIARWWMIVCVWSPHWQPLTVAKLSSLCTPHYAKCYGDQNIVVLWVWLWRNNVVTTLCTVSMTNQDLIKLLLGPPWALNTQKPKNIRCINSVHLSTKCVSWEATCRLLSMTNIVVEIYREWYDSIIYWHPDRTRPHYKILENNDNDCLS